MKNYFRSWKINKQQGGLDFMGKYPTFEEAIKHGDFCDYVDNDCHVHNVLDNGIDGIIMKAIGKISTNVKCMKSCGKMRNIHIFHIMQEKYLDVKHGEGVINNDYIQNLLQRKERAQTWNLGKSGDLVCRSSR